MSRLFPRSASLLLGLIIFLVGFSVVTSAALAQVLSARPAPTGLPAAPFDLDGYLWSSTIGWVSLNCKTGGATGNDICATSNYKVTVTPATGNLNGYAWSSNVGWIRFGGLSSFPAGNGNTQLDAMLSGNYASMTLYGWARACSGTDSAPGTCSSMGNSTVSGSWDGWISLRGTSPNYGITTSGAVTSGAGVASSSFAWGGAVVGWIGFDLMRLSLPTATLSGTGCSMVIASTTCAARLNWSFSTNPAVASRNIRRATPLPVVSNIGGVTPSVTGSVTVTLSVGPNVFQARSNTLVLAAVTLTPSCSSPNQFFTPPGICDQLPPVVTINASKSLVRIDDVVTVTWTISPPAPATTLSPNTQCRVFGPGMPAGVQLNPGNSAVSLPVRNATQFKVVCTGSFSATLGDAEASVNVDVIPLTQEV